MNWDLTKLYKGFDDSEFLSDVDALKAGIAELLGMAKAAKPKENVPATAEALLEQLLNVQGLFIKLGRFSFLTIAANANDETARGYRDRLMALEVDFTQSYSLITAFIGAANPELFQQKGYPLIEEHQYLIELMRRSCAHLIDPAIEPTVLKMMMTGGYAWEQLRSDLDAKLMIPFVQDGEEKQLPLSAIRGLAYSPDQAVRKAAYEAELRSYPRVEASVAACLNGIKGEALVVAELMHYDSVLDRALDTARISRSTLDALITAMKASLPDFRRYFHKKAKLLGHENGLPFYDLFAPLGGDAPSEYTLQSARQKLLEVFRPFSPRMADMIERAFSQRWIDAYPREGKVGGAFCANVHPLGMSYVLTNFEGSMSSVGTLAHELGHAYHNECTKHLSAINSDYPMPLAETASIFNETMLMDTMLKEASGKDVLRLIDQQLIDASQVVVDILSRYLFETEVIERRAARTLSANELCEIMLDAQKKTYGDGLDPAYMHPYMWLCKSHYYSPDVHFYNFPYAFGLLFGLGVFALYKERGPAFREDYDRLLASTGLMDVKDVAASVGIDVDDVAFWSGSLSVIKGWIDTMG